jgi:hypothetical protein
MSVEVTSYKAGRFEWRAIVSDIASLVVYDGYGWTRERAEAKAMKAYAKHRTWIDGMEGTKRTREVSA